VLVGIPELGSVRKRIVSTRDVEKQVMLEMLDDIHQCLPWQIGGMGYVLPHVSLLVKARQVGTTRADLP
jgi:hypothetical protein